MEPTPTLIYETVHGSTAYGLAIATSDVDKKLPAAPDEARLDRLCCEIVDDVLAAAR